LALFFVVVTLYLSFSFYAFFALLSSSIAMSFLHKDTEQISMKFAVGVNRFFYYILDEFGTGTREQDKTEYSNRCQSAFIGAK